MKIRPAVSPQEPEPKIKLPQIWSDEHGVAVRGWILTSNGPPDSLELILDGTPIPVKSWHARRDLIAKHPEYRSGEKCGFWAYLPKAPLHEMQIKARTGNDVFTRVLQVADENTDVVGDAHQLASYFPDERFDAVFSLSVLEHLAMPWLVAAEINKVLRPGGLTFHLTHFIFPLHEQPADYWRFTGEGLRSLFSSAVGFGEAETESSKPASVYPHDRPPELLHLPGRPAYIHVAVLAAKVREVDDSKIRWTPPGVASASYPAPGGLDLAVGREAG